MKSSVRYSIKRGHADKRGLCDVEMTVNAGGRRWRCLAGVKCRAAGDFDLDRQAFVRSAKPVKGGLTVTAAEANAALDVVRGAVLRLFTPLTEWPPVDEVRRTVSEAAGKAERAERRTVGGFEALADAFLDSRRCSGNRRSGLSRLLRILSFAERTGMRGLSPLDFDPQRYEAYRTRLGAELDKLRRGEAADAALTAPWRDVPRTKWPKALSRNTLGQEMTAVRSVFLWAYRAGVLPSDPFAAGAYERPKGVYGTPYYPNKAELDRFAAADLPEALAEARDLFVFQSCVGCRVSDLAAFTPDNVSGGRLHYIARKTAGKRPETVEVPLSRKALDVLARWEAKGLFLPPLRSDKTKYNVLIKKAFKAAGLDRRVEVLDRHTGVPAVRPLYEVASSHMARRTFVGNLVNAGVKDSVIGSMSGHVPGSQAFARYYTVEDGIKTAAVAALD